MEKRKKAKRLDCNNNFGNGLLFRARNLGRKRNQEQRKWRTNKRKRR